jgi:hypothetical protein
MEVVTRVARTVPDGGCHTRLSLRAPRAFRDDARTSSLVRHHHYSHVGGRLLLARLGSATASRSPRGPRVVAACPHRGPPLLALWIGKPPPPCHRSENHRRYSGSRNRRHRASKTGSHRHRNHRPKDRRRRHSWATATIAHV